jgi:hypothetical protein
MSHTLIDDAIWARLASLIRPVASGAGIGTAGRRFQTAPF